MEVGILALQGSVSEHHMVFRKCGVAFHDVRLPKDLNGINGLVMPGGESTTLRKLLKNSGLWKELEKGTIPILGTCAGAVLLGNCDDDTLGLVNINILRNAYGRQIDSFESEITLETDEFDGISKFPGVFIRAPQIENVFGNCKVIAHLENEIVGVKQGKHMALTFHPELTDDCLLHEKWISELE